MGEWHVLLHTIGRSVHMCNPNLPFHGNTLYCYCNLHLQHPNEECLKLEMLAIYINISIYIYMYVSVLILKTRTCLAFFAIYFAYV